MAFSSKTVAYLRVSSLDQDLDKNHAEILKLAHEKKLGQVEFVEDKVSGKISWRHRKISNILETLNTNDNLIVSELSRLGRSMLECMEILSIITQKGINIYAVKGNWQLDKSIQSRIVAMAFAMAAEIEHDLISKRTREALNAKRAAGFSLGRPKGPGKSKLDRYQVEIEALLGNGSTKTFIAARYGTTPANLHNWLKKNGVKREPLLSGKNMMSKRLPPDILVMLHNRLGTLRARDPARRLIIEEAAQFYNISKATLYRALHQHNQLTTAHRSDYHQPRMMTRSDMQRYCEIVAALKLRTTNKKGRHLSTKECIRLLEQYGVETPNGLVKTPVGLLKRTTIDFYLHRLGLDKKSLHIQPTVVHFEATHSNACWQFDFSRSDFKHFPDDQAKHKSKDALPVLMLASVVDDRSGAMYQEYHYIHGEDVMTALMFLFNAMAPKKHVGDSFQGIPRMIYLDNGPVAKSAVFKRVMAYLDIEIRTHMPDGKDGRRKTARSKGKVERPFRTVKESLETLYHLHPPRNLVEANDWLRHYLQRYNAESHRREKHSRLEDWKRNLPSDGFRAMCDWERFSTMAREPETRKVGSDACVTINGVKYQLSNELAGFTVTLLWGLFDHELRVEYENQYYGPFYPSEGPIPLDQYRAFKKSQREVRADHVGDFARTISISRAALGPEDKDLLIEFGLAEEPLNYIPFSSENPYSSTLFKDVIEAKTAVARWLGFPLGRLPPEQIVQINNIVAQCLDKKQVMSMIQQIFKPKLINQEDQ